MYFFYFIKFQILLDRKISEGTRFPFSIKASFIQCRHSGCFKTNLPTRQLEKGFMIQLLTTQDVMHLWKKLNKLFNSKPLKQTRQFHVFTLLIGGKRFNVLKCAEYFRTILKLMIYKFHDLMYILLCPSYLIKIWVSGPCKIISKGISY